MPKIIEKLNADQLNRFVIDFHNKMLFLRLVNSGMSYSKEQRIEYVKQAFDVAYSILVHAANTKDVSLFNRICAETKELVPASNTIVEIEKIQNDFYTKTNVLRISQYLASRGQGR